MNNVSELSEKILVLFFSAFLIRLARSLHTSHVQERQNISANEALEWDNFDHLVGTNLQN
jgi:hypothetical protein